MRARQAQVASFGLDAAVAAPAARPVRRRSRSVETIAPYRNGPNGIGKRAIDVAVAASAMCVLALPLACIALLVKLTSRGPVFYRQERIGRGGRPFTMIKFRSMRCNAEAATGPVWATADDPRVTRFGRFLRRSNFDELPQLWNVLCGDMSMVGPRPERPHFVSQFERRVPRYRLRHQVQAGLTGWAQVNGWRGNTPIETRLQYDIAYIRNWSVQLDCKILWLTLTRAFFHHHAY